MRVGRGAGTRQGTETRLIQAERTSCANVKMHRMVPFIQRMVRNWVGLEHSIPGRGGKKKKKKNEAKRFVDDEMLYWVLRVMVAS